MPTVEESIETALLARVLSLDVTGDPPVAWPNVAFPNEGEQKPATYIEVRHFPNRSTRRYLAGSAPHLRQGILQLTVFTPLHVGPAPATKLVGEIAEHFPADLDLFEGGIRIRMQQDPDVIPAGKTDDGVSWSARVDVRYETHA